MSEIKSHFGCNKRPVVRDDGRYFESLAMAVIATFGSCCGTGKIVRACKTGEPLRGHTFRFAEGAGR